MDVSISLSMEIISNTYIYQNTMLYTLKKWIPQKKTWFKQKIK